MFTFTNSTTEWQFKEALYDGLVRGLGLVYGALHIPCVIAHGREVRAIKWARDMGYIATYFEPTKVLTVEAFGC